MRKKKAPEGQKRDLSRPGSSISESTARSSIGPSTFSKTAEAQLGHASLSTTAESGAPKRTILELFWVISWQSCRRFVPRVKHLFAPMSSPENQQGLHRGSPVS